MLFPEFPLVAAVTAGVLLVLQQILLVTVGAHRGAVKIGAGTGGDTALERKIRRHGNLAENAAIFLVVLALLELSGAAPIGVGLLAATFVAARLIHAAAFSSEAASHLAPGPKVFPAMRAIGGIGTALLGTAAALWLLIRVVPALLAFGGAG